MVAVGAAKAMETLASNGLFTDFPIIQCYDRPTVMNRSSVCRRSDGPRGKIGLVPSSVTMSGMSQNAKNAGFHAIPLR